MNPNNIGNTDITNESFTRISAGRCRVKRDETLDLTAELLAEGYELHEITLLALTEHAVRRLVNRAVDFELSGGNIDRPNAEKYGTHPDGTARYAPEWYAVQGAKTGIVEGLHGALRSVLTCPSTDEHGHACIGSIGHETWHWDGDGCNWLRNELEQQRTDLARIAFLAGPEGYAEGADDVRTLTTHRYELGWVALGETMSDDDGCEAARAMGESIVGSEEMQAIKAVLRHLAVRQATEVQAPTVDVLRLLGLPEIVIDWVLS